MSTHQAPGLASLATLVSAVVAATILAAAALRRDAAAPLTLTEALRGAAPRPSAAAEQEGLHEYDAYLVMQRADCEGNVYALRFLQRPAIRQRVRFAGLLLVGSDADHAAVRSRLGDTPHGAPLRHADDATVRALRTIGYRSTPFLVIAERHGGVKMTLQLPRTPEELAAFARLLPHLASVTSPPR